MTLVLADIQDLPYEEIARVLDVPVGTVKSRVHRGRMHWLGRWAWMAPTGNRPPPPGRRRKSHDPSRRAPRQLCGRHPLREGPGGRRGTSRGVQPVQPRGRAGSRGPDRAAVAHGGPGSSGCCHEGPRGATGARPAVGGTPRWYRFGGIAAAVAAGLLVFTLVLPHIGNGAGGASEASQGKDQGPPRALERGAALAAASADRDPARERRRRLVDRLTSSYRSPIPGSERSGTAAAPVAPASAPQAQTGKALDVHLDGFRSRRRAPNAHPGPVQGHARLPAVFLPRAPALVEPADTVAVRGSRHEGLRDRLASRPVRSSATAGSRSVPGNTRALRLWEDWIRHDGRLRNVI